MLQRIFLIVFAFSMYLFAQPSGKVLETGTNTPLAKAMVSVQSSGDMELTNNNGEFSFASTGAIASKLPRKAAQVISLSGNNLNLDLNYLTASVQVTVSLFDLKGARIATLFDNPCHKGLYKIPLSIRLRANAIYLLKTIIGTESFVYPIILNNSSRIAGNWKLATENSPRLTCNFLKKLVTGNSSDTLVVSKYGYYPATQPISSNASNITINIKKMPADSLIPPGMKNIPEGTFMMGSENGDPGETPIHQVTLSGFFMDSTEVTQGDYYCLLKVRPWTSVDQANKGADDNHHPAWNIGWYDAVVYCNVRSKRDGLDTVYKFTKMLGKPGDGNDSMDVMIDYTKKGYRLPTEAEWEYACRAGTTTDYYWGNQPDSAKNYAWDRSNSGPTSRLLTTHPVAQKLSNNFGLYDMSGNVWEYCNDYDGMYPSYSQIDPIGEANGELWGWVRITRGGNWTSFETMIRSARRGACDPAIKDSKASGMGVRCVKRK